MEVSDLGTTVSSVDALVYALVNNTASLTTEVTGLSGNVAAMDTTVYALSNNNASLTIEISNLSSSVAATNTDLSLLRKILSNKKITDPNTGIITVYDDDDSVLFTAAIYEDAAGTVAYKGQGLERQEKLA